MEEFCVLTSKFHVHNQPAAQIKHSDTETMQESFRKLSYGYFKNILRSTSDLLPLILTIKHLRGTQDLVGWMLPWPHLPQSAPGGGGRPSGWQSTRTPRGSQGARGMLPAETRKLLLPRGIPHRTLSAGSPLWEGAAPRPSQEPFNHELQDPPSGIPSGDPFGWEVLWDPHPRIFSFHTYLGVEPQGSLVLAPLEFPVSLLPVPAGGLRLLVRACPVAQPHQGCLLLLLAPVGHRVSTGESVWNRLVQPPAPAG